MDAGATPQLLASAIVKGPSLFVVPASAGRRSDAVVPRGMANLPKAVPRKGGTTNKLGQVVLSYAPVNVGQV